MLGCIIIISGIAISDPIGSQSSNNSTVMLSHLVNISDIVKNSDEYNGELVTIDGTYLGWTGPGTGAQLTKSDWGVEDKTGSIYVSGGNPGLDPYNDVGVNLIVLGIVHLIDGAPYLEGRAITLIDANNNTKWGDEIWCVCCSDHHIYTATVDNLGTTCRYLGGPFASEGAQKYIKSFYPNYKC